MKGFELVELLPDADELDRDARNRLHRQRRAPTGVAIELGEDHPIELEGVVEGFGRVDRVLPGHGVADEQDLLRAQLKINLLDFAHQRFIDMQPAGRIEDDDVAIAQFLRRGDAVLADFDGIRPGGLAVNRHTELFADDLELLDGGGALHVGRDQHRLPALVEKHL